VRRGARAQYPRRGATTTHPSSWLNQQIPTRSRVLLRGGGARRATRTGYGVRGQDVNGARLTRRAGRYYFHRMGTTADLVARAVRENSPHARCFRCLSRQVGRTEKDVREAAQLLIVADRLHTARRVCHICGCTNDVLVPGLRSEDAA
jgi:hypothetical protein